jgi:predicted O-linked N-acetylglucosamine transferase (SPINDLY family)
MLFDAAWMGVPIVTLASSRPVGRIGASLMTNLGLPEWVTENELGYEDTAVAFSQNISKLAEIRNEIRVRMQHSPIMNEKLFAQDVENAYRKMWASWLISTNNQM